MNIEEPNIIEKTTLSILIRCEDWDKKLNKLGIKLNPEDFIKSDCIELYNFILNNANKDIYGVKNLLLSIKNNSLLKQNLLAKVKDVLTITTNINHLEFYANSLKKHITKDKLISELKQFSKQLNVDDIYKHINSLSNKLQTIIDDETIDADKYEIPNMNNIIIDKMTNDAINNGVIGKRLNKFRNIQDKLSGLQNGLILVGGDPNVGKTKFTTNLFWDCVKSNPNDIGIYISLDDTRDDILTNLISIEAYDSDRSFNLSQTNTKQPYLLDDTNQLKERYYNALDTVREYGQNKRFVIYDIDTIDNFDMMMLHLNKIIKKINKNVFIFIDGVFNLDVSTKVRSDDLRSQGIARANLLKQLADKNNLPLLATIELGKRKNDGKYKEPTYQEIMETGKFAYNAKLIWLLSWNDFIEENDNTIYPKLRFAKNKFTGYKGSMYLEFNRSCGHVSINNSEKARNIYEEKLNIGRKKDAKQF